MAGYHNVWVCFPKDADPTNPISITVSSTSTVGDVVSAVIDECQPKTKCLTPRFDGKSISPMMMVENLITSKENPLILFEGKNILTHGLVPVVWIGRSSSSYSILDHERVYFVESDFGFSDHKPGVMCGRSQLWVNHNLLAERRKNLQWGVENQLSSYVTWTLNDVCAEAGLDGLECRAEWALFDAKRPDIWIVCSYGVPIGVVELKKSTSSEQSGLGSRRVLGKLFDYVTYLKAYGGRRNAFGILTTYNEWHIVWLSDADEEAKSIPTITGVQQRPIGSKGLLPLEPPDWDKESGTFPLEPTASEVTVMEEFKKPRVLFGSRLYQWNDPNLPHILLSVLCKMVSSPVIPTSISKLEQHRSYIYVTEHKWQWEIVPQDTPLSIEGTIPSHFQSAFLLADLGGGGDGRVWLASTKTGKVCVLKFFRVESTLKREAQIWKKAWSCDVSVKQLNGRPVLVMPWVKPCTKEEIKWPEVREAVREAIQTLANAGYEHDDLHLRHVGLYKKESRLKALLFDLARVRNIARDKQANVDAISRMMETLKIE